MWAGPIKTKLWVSPTKLAGWARCSQWNYTSCVWIKFGTLHFVYIELFCLYQIRTRRKPNVLPCRSGPLLLISPLNRPHSSKHSLWFSFFSTTIVPLWWFFTTCIQLYSFGETHLTWCSGSKCTWPHLISCISSNKKSQLFAFTFKISDPQSLGIFFFSHFFNPWMWIHISVGVASYFHQAVFSL